MCNQCVRKISKLLGLTPGLWSQIQNDIWKVPGYESSGGPDANGLRVLGGPETLL